MSGLLTVQLSCSVLVCIEPFAAAAAFKVGEKSVAAKENGLKREIDVAYEDAGVCWSTILAWLYWWREINFWREKQKGCFAG